MKGLLVRVAADQTNIGGKYNGPVDSNTKTFAYVAIRESKRIRSGQYKKLYQLVNGSVSKFGQSLPKRLVDEPMHLDPDFEHLTYGDENQRGKQITDHVEEGDLIVFYAGLQDIYNHRPLVYAIIGLYVIDEIVENISQIPEPRWNENAHTRLIPSDNSNDIVVRAKPDCSGRLQSCIPIGGYRKNAYRVRRDLLKAWGGISSNDGYIQRSARLPKLKDPEKFYDWFLRQNPVFLKRNN